MPDLSDDEILAALEVSVEPEKPKAQSARDERVVAGFEDILRFVDEHGRAPQHGEERDIFERLYAVRLAQLRLLPDAHELLAAIDKHGLLAGTGQVDLPVDTDLDDEALLAELGAEAEPADDITQLKHVKSRAEINAAEDVANRTPCKDFETFRPLFERVQRDLDSGLRQSRRFGRDAEIAAGEFFILGGQTVYVAEMDEAFRTDYGRTDARLRVIFSNRTESDMLLRSLQRALYKDDAGRRVTAPDAGPLFTDEQQPDDIASGTIYVLRSNSEHPEIKARRDVLHKIGVTGGNVERRVANARKDTTFLSADVEIVRQYPLFNINRTRLESLLHRFLAPARFTLEISDRMGNPIKPREWFIIPLERIDEVVDRIADGSIERLEYNPQQVSLTPKTAD